jgi:hypothetical protein
VALAHNRAESHVTPGENAGRSLAHVGVTRILQQLGTIDLSSGSAKEVVLTVQPGAGANGLRVVAFIQDPKIHDLRASRIRSKCRESDQSAG